MEMEALAWDTPDGMNKHVYYNTKYHNLDGSHRSTAYSFQQSIFEDATNC